MAKKIEDLPSPNQSRNESYLGVIAGQPGAEMPDRPLSREEEFLEYIATHGGGGGGEPAEYLKRINKDEKKEEISITDKSEKETVFPYGSSKKNSYASLTKVRDYVHQAVYTDIDYDKAYAFFEAMKPAENVIADDYKPMPSFEKPIGACSAFYFMGVLARMYDWNYNKQNTIEVKTPAVGDRYAVTGTAYNKKITKDIVESGKYNENFDYIPFELVDGVNEHGFAIAMLVVPNDYGITTGTTPEETENEVSMLMLPRYLLDHAIDIDDAMYYLQKKVSVYNVMPLIQMGYEIHYYVVDARGNHGVIEFINNTPVFHNAEAATNFYIHGVNFNDDGTVYTPATQDADHDAKRTNQVTDFGSGLERYNLIINSLKNVKEESDIVLLLSNLMYTNAYKKTTDPFWYTEFVGGEYKVNTPAATYDAEGGIVERAIGEFGRRDRETGTTWQTVHGGLIDCKNKTMFLAFQEDITKIYGFGFNYYTAEQIDNMVREAGEGNIKYDRDQNLSNSAFNQVMKNLKLNASIEEYGTLETIYESNMIDVAFEAPGYTINNAEVREFNPEKSYEIPLTFGSLGTINVFGQYKTERTLTLKAEFAGVYFSSLEVKDTDIIISVKTELSEVPHLTEARIDEVTYQRDVTPIDSEFIPHDDTKQNVTDNRLATVAKTVVDAVNEVNERVDNITPKGRFLSYWNAATGMPETNPSTIPFEFNSGDWFSISVVAGDGDTNYRPTPEAYDGNPSTIVETDPIEKGDVYRYDGTVWKWEHTAQRDVQFRDILGSPFDNTALKNALDGKVDQDYYATAERMGLIKVAKRYGTDIGNPEGYMGILMTRAQDNVEDYNNYSNYAFVGKGILEKLIAAGHFHATTITLTGSSGTLTTEQLDLLKNNNNTLISIGEIVYSRNVLAKSETYMMYTELNIGGTIFAGTPYLRQININKNTGAWTSGGIELIKATDFAYYNKAGVHKVSEDVHAVGVDQDTGYLYAIIKTKEQFDALGDTAFISKGTLENLISADHILGGSTRVPFLLEYADGTSETLNMIAESTSNNNVVDESDNQGGELDG